MSIDSLDLQYRSSTEADSSVTPKSSAWLLADGAFTLPHRPPAAAALVTVRKSRIPVLSTPAPALLNDGAQGLSLQEGKGARVFRIETAVGGADAGPEPQGTRMSPAKVPGPTFLTQATAPMSLKKRLNEDKRPGPVLRTVSLPLERASELDEIHRASSGMSKAELSGLVRMMAELNPILADIERASAFRFIDGPEA